MSSPPVMTRVDQFEQLLAAEEGAWAAAKRDAFQRLCEAFAGPEGPTPDGLRQIERGQFDARLPGEWKPVFVEVYQQWLGFVAEHRSTPAATRVYPRWWTAALPPLRPHLGQLGWIASPAAVATLAFALVGWRAAAGASVRGNAAHALEIRRIGAEATIGDLADAERLARARLASVSDATITSFLANEPTLRSRHEAAAASRAELAAELIRAETALERSRFPRWPSDARAR